MDSRILITVIAFMILLNDTEGFKFTVSESRGTWTQGLSACQGVQGTLAVLNSQEFRDTFNSQTTTTPMGEKFWLGSYESYTKMVWIQGCFANTTLPAQRRTIRIQNNYLVKCLHECTNSTYLGMQGEYCYCFDSIPVNGGNLPGSACQNSCPGEPVSPQTPGNYLSECGSYQPPGFSPVSVYRLARPDEIRMENNSVSLGECIAYNVRTQMWVPRVCTFPNLLSCDRINCNLPPQQCIMEIPTQVSWYRARLLCESNQAHLAVTNASTFAYFNNKRVPGMGDLLYWTGLHRKQHMLWTLDKETTTMQSSGRCVAGMKNQVGGWVTTLEDCRQNYRYICLEELIPTTSTTTSTTTTSTTAFTTPSPWDPWATTTTDGITFNPNPQPVNVTTPSGADSLFSFSKFCLTSIVTVLLHIVFI